MLREIKEEAAHRSIFLHDNGGDKELRVVESKWATNEGEKLDLYV